MTPMMMEMLNREIQFPICANQIQLSCAVTQVLTLVFTWICSCDKGIMRDGGGVLEYCRMKKIPVQAWSSLQLWIFQGTFLGSDNYRELNTVLNRIASERWSLLWLLLLLDSSLSWSNSGCNRHYKIDSCP